jgi:hypothetical protein
VEPCGRFVANPAQLILHRVQFVHLLKAEKKTGINVERVTGKKLKSVLPRVYLI